MAVAPRKPPATVSRAPSSAIAKRGSAARALHSALRRGGVGPPVNGVFDVNERCIEMLVNAAREERAGSFALVADLRELLKSLDPAMRQRAARCAFLLADMELGNGDWWHVAHTHPTQPIRTPPWRGSFPRPSAIQLARATLLLAWNSLRVDPATTQILLGLTTPVAEVIVALRLDEIDRIARTRFRHIRPRWDDRPAVWQRLLIAAQKGDEELLTEFNLHALQLLIGELIPAS